LKDCRNEISRTRHDDRHRPHAGEDEGNDEGRDPAEQKAELAEVDADVVPAGDKCRGEERDKDGAVDFLKPPAVFL